MQYSTAVDSNNACNQIVIALLGTQPTASKLKALKANCYP